MATQDSSLLEQVFRGFDEYVPRDAARTAHGEKPNASPAEQDKQPGDVLKGVVIADKAAQDESHFTKPTEQDEKRDESTLKDAEVADERTAQDKNFALIATKQDEQFDKDALKIEDEKTTNSMNGTDNRSTGGAVSFDEYVLKCMGIGDE
jgi:hypothetical protein